MNVGGLFTSLKHAVLLTNCDNKPRPNYYERKARKNIVEIDLLSGSHWNEFSMKDLECFFRLMDTKIITAFLQHDKCYELADNYLLAMVFVYFKRANLSHSEYTSLNFFTALYLAHDIEEDDEELKYSLVNWGLSKTLKDNHEYFINLRNDLWKAMGYRACVSLQCCLQVMKSSPNNPLWKRMRSAAHSGANRSYGKEEECENCKEKKIKLYYSDSEEEDSDSDISSCDEFEWTPAKKKMRSSEE